MKTYIKVWKGERLTKETCKNMSNLLGKTSVEMMEQAKKSLKTGHKKEALVFYRASKKAGDLAEWWLGQVGKTYKRASFEVEI